MYTRGFSACHTTPHTHHDHNHSHSPQRHTHTHTIDHTTCTPTHNITHTNITRRQRQRKKTEKERETREDEKDERQDTRRQDRTGQDKTRQDLSGTPSSMSSPPRVKTTALTQNEEYRTVAIDNPLTVFNYLQNSNSIFRAAGINSEKVFGSTVFGCLADRQSRRDKRNDPIIN